MEQTVLHQGITLPAPPLTSNEPLPAPLQLPEQLPSGSGEQHQFTLPTNAAGAAKTSRRQRSILPRPLASPTSPSTFLHVPNLHVTTSPSPSTLPVSH